MTNELRGYWSSPRFPFPSVGNDRLVSAALGGVFLPTVVDSSCSRTTLVHEYPELSFA